MTRTQILQQHRVDLRAGLRTFYRGAGAERLRTGSLENLRGRAANRPVVLPQIIQLLLVDLRLDIHRTSLTVMIVRADRLEMIAWLVSALDPVVPVIILNRLHEIVVSAQLSHTPFRFMGLVIHDLIGRGKGCI